MFKVLSVENRKKLKSRLVTQPQGLVVYVTSQGSPLLLTAGTQLYLPAEIARSWFHEIFGCCFAE